MNFLGFLRRTRSSTRGSMNRPSGDYVLVTGGGGGDGAQMMFQVLRAYSEGGETLPRALFVLGPLMSNEERSELFRMAAKTDRVDVIEFDNNMEELIEGASAVVGMGGYNTFCEVLSFNKPGMIVPRTHPREEQLIRAVRAAELGLIDFMLPEEADDPVALARRLRALPQRALPEEAGGAKMLDGLESIRKSISGWAEKRPAADLYSIVGAS
jgi:predicted glycosyltransferase